MTQTGVQLAAVATALPPAIAQDEIWQECFRARYRTIPGAARVWRSAGVETRHAVVDPRVEDVGDWSTGARMARYLVEAMPLAKRAVQDAIDAAHLCSEDIDLFTVVSCTGYATPGLDLLLARDVGMPAATQRVTIGHMGCHAALPALATAADAVVARSLTALVLCVELPSLHLQPPSRDLDQLVTHALFSDAAAAIVLRPLPGGLQVADTAACTDTAHLDAMTWTVTDLGFRMGLSPQVPTVLAQHARPMIDALLARNGLTLADVGGWAIHPGGPRILDVCGQVLDLDETQLEPSRETLREHGNCSSATVLLVVERLLGSAAQLAGRPVVAMAFGPGLTLHATLLRAAPSPP
jgi:predicted naringenin-chalcone synthase